MRYSENRKKEIVNFYLEGASVKSLCEKHQVSKSTIQETPLVLKAFKQAFEKCNKPKELLFHSDQGGQYISYEFRKYLRDRRVKQSFSNPGSPYDNAVAESFFRTIKAEEIYSHFYKTADELFDSVAEYIDFFNNKRPHQKFSYRTPYEVEKDYFNK